MNKKNGFLRMKKDNRGDALIIVVCVLAVLISLSVSLLLSVSTLVESTKKITDSERCRIMAVSFSDMVAEELVDFEGTSSKDLPNYIKEEIKNGWRCYDPAMVSSIEAASKSFDILNDGKQLGDQLSDHHVFAEMYWINGSDWDDSEEDVSEEGGSEEGDPDEDQAYDGLELIIIITVKKDQEMFKVQTSYILSVEGDEWLWEKGIRR